MGSLPMRISGSPNKTPLVATTREIHLSYRIFYLALRLSNHYTLSQQCSLGPDGVSRMQMRTGQQLDLSEALDTFQCAKWLTSL